MMLPSIGEIVTRYGKIIFAFWTVVALVAIAPACSLIEDCDTSFNQMDEEYNRTMEYMRVYCDDPQLDYSKCDILTIGYDSADGYRQLQGDTAVSLKPFTEYLYDRLSDDDYWRLRLDFSFGGVTTLTSEGDSDDGVILVAFNFREKIIGDDGKVIVSKVTESDMENYTKDLRSSIENIKADYMYELYEKDCHFSTNLTGTYASEYDTYSHLVIYGGIAALITVIFSLVVMGLFFGSAITSVISTISILVSALVTMASLKYLSTMREVPLEYVLVIVILITMVSLMHNILIISAYRRRILAGRDKKESLKETSVLSSKLIMVSLVCILICCVTLSFSGSKVMSTEGICFGIGAIVVSLVSMTVPTSLIHITKNQMFWMRNKDRKIRWSFIDRAYTVFDSTVKKITDMTAERRLRTNIVVIILLLAVFGTSLAYVVTSGTLSDSSFDMEGSFATGESKAGTEKMAAYSCGGVTDPYKVLIEFDHPIGYIERDYSLLGYSVLKITWCTGGYDSELDTLINSIYACDEKNISNVSSIVKWDRLVEEALDAGITDPQEIMDYAVSSLEIDDWAAAVNLRIVLEDLQSTLLPSVIVYYLGDLIDYEVNESLGAIGYHMNDSKQIVIDRVMLHVYTGDTASSAVSQKTSERIDSAVGSFVKNTNDVKGSKCAGPSSAYNNISKDINSKYLIVSLIVLVLLFITMAVLERKIVFTTVNFVSSIIGIVFSAAVVTFISKILNTGSVENTVLMVIPILCAILCTWFGSIQSYCSHHYHDIGQMRKTVDPIIIVTTILLVIFSALMALTDITGIYMVAISVIIVVLVECILIRIIVSPSLWKILKISFEEKKEEPSDAEQQ